MSPVKQSPRSKKREILTKKAPGAPKRFKSSYILFFMHVQEDIKKKLPPGTHTAPVVSKKASELWRNLPAEERSHWNKEAAKEKKRYIAEKELYTGPWQVPHTRAKKDPTAPRRNPSAFLLYSVKKRQEIKKKNPELKTTDISRMLGRIWRETPKEEKRPFIEREKIERFEYKEKMCAWKGKKEKKDLEEAEKRKQVKADETEAKKPSDDFADETFIQREGEDLSPHEDRSHDSNADFQSNNTPEVVLSGAVDQWFKWTTDSQSNNTPEVVLSGPDQWFKWTTDEMNKAQDQNTQEGPLRRHSPYKEHQHHRKYSPTLQQQPYENHQHHHPCRVESRPAASYQLSPRYSPIPLYRENMFCPSPISRQSEAFQYRQQPEYLPSWGCWPSPPPQFYHRGDNQNRPSIEASFSRDPSDTVFDRNDKPNQQFYKQQHDQELDCSPIGSYDEEFDPQFDPVPIH